MIKKPLFLCKFPNWDYLITFQDQEWNVVNVVERRTRTLSDNVPPDSTIRSKYLRVNFTDIKSFKVSRSSTKLTFFEGKGDVLCTFEFKNGNCDSLVSTLKGLLRTMPAKRDKHTFIVLEDYPETHMLDKSFAGLNLFTEEPHHIWKFIKTFQESPYTAGMEAFAKVSDIGNYIWTYYFTVFDIGIYFVNLCCDMSFSIIALNVKTNTNSVSKF